MKRKIAILLASVMTATMLPMSAIAATISPNSVTTATLVQAGEQIGTDVKVPTLTSTPNDNIKPAEVNQFLSDLKGRAAVLKLDVKDGGADLMKGTTSIKLTLTNGKFDYTSASGADEDAKKVEEAKKFAYKNINSTTVQAGTTIGKVFDGTSAITNKTSFGAMMEEVAGMKTNFAAGDVFNLGLPHIPYEFEILSETEAQVNLVTDIKYSDIISTQIPSAYVNEAAAGAAVDFKAKGLQNAYFAIPLGAVKSTGEGDVKVTVSSPYATNVSTGEFTIAKVATSGSTVTNVGEIKVFDDKAMLDKVVIRENIRNTFKKGSKITLRLNNGFKFIEDSSKKFQILNDKDGKPLPETNKTIDLSNNSKITFSIEDQTFLDDNGNIRGIRFDNLMVAPVNADSNYGNVELNVFGDNISETTTKVAVREKLGFKVQTTTEVPTITKGRYYALNQNLDQKSNNAAEVLFEELVANSLVLNRALDFNVPAGVKIVDAELVANSIKGVANNSLATSTNADSSDFEIVNSGKTLRLKRNSFDPTLTTPPRGEKISFKLKMKLSIDAGFKEDEVKLNVTGGGQNDGSNQEVVISKVANPFTIETKSTDINIGYMSYDTADVVVSETKPGMFMEGDYVELSIDAPYDAQAIAFTNQAVEVSGGEVKVEDLGRNGKIVKVKIKEASRKNPSTLRFKNLKVGTSRAIPYGAFSLKIGGKALINNKPSTADVNFVIAQPNDADATKAKEKAADRIKTDTSNYSYSKYINVITETGTLDYSVGVTVGEKTAVIGSKTVDMDVAPYIQASSNSTMVPLRFVSVALGVDNGNISNPDASSKVSWNADSKTATIFYGAGLGQKIIQFQANSNKMIVDGTAIPMEYGVVAEIKEGRLFVPFRALGQALGVSVSWNADTRTAIYNEKSIVTTTTTTESTSTTTTQKGTTTKETTTETTTKK